VAGRREDPGFVLGSGGADFGHAVVSGQDEFPDAVPPIVILALALFEAVGPFGVCR
jgi:hypothetical protein